MRNKYARLYIDFDGVICDSAYEAFVCSYLAYYHLHAIEDATAATEQQTLFQRYRPFIRSGQHFMLLQYCIENGILLSSQDDFERQLQSKTDQQLRQWRTVLYRTRATLIDQRLPDYLGFHTFYQHVRDVLQALSYNPRVFILSTKKEHLISLLLSGIGITWARERILMSHTHSKIHMVNDARRDHAERVAFIDDHLPHILSIEQGKERGIDCYLADWGYTLPDWRSDRAYAHLNAQSFVELVTPFT